MAFAAANAIASKMRHVASVKPTFRMIFAAAPSQSEVLDAPYRYTEPALGTK